MAIAERDGPTDQMSELELFLLQLRYREGRLIEAEGNRPVMLDDPSVAYVIYTGAVDVFAVWLAGGETDGARQHLFRCAAGQLIFGAAPDPAAGELRLLARGTPGTRLLRIRQERIWSMAAELEYSGLLADMAAPWLQSLGERIAPGLPPKETALVEVGRTADSAAGGPFALARGLGWLRLEAGSLCLFGDPALAWQGPLPLPLSRGVWVEAAAQTSFALTDSAAVLQGPDAAAALAAFQRLVLGSLHRSALALGAQEQARWAARVELEQSQMRRALVQLGATLSPELAAAAPPRRGSDALLDACRQIGAWLGVEFPDLPREAAERPLGEQLKLIARVARVRMRSVALRGAWWRGDHGPLLAFGASDQRPLALLPARGGYTLHDPALGTASRVTPAAAAEVLPLAYSVYRPLPAGPLSAWDLLRFGLRGSERDLLLVLGAGALAGLLGLLPAVATGWIINQLVPEGQVDQLVAVGLGLLLVALSSGALQIARGLTLLRVQSRLDASLQAAIWDRLLSLPVPFFRSYTSGDLGARAMGISEIRAMLAGHMVTTLLNSVFSLFNLALLYYYAPGLASVALGLVALALAVTLLIGRAYLRNQRVLQAIQAEVGSVVLQLLRGIVKIRVSGAENHAFAQWAERFARQKQRYYRGRSIGNLLVAYNAAYPLLILMLIFALLSFAPQFRLSAGDFLAFNLAFSQFLGAWFLLGASLIYMLPLIPIVERLRPILEATPEVDALKVRPGALTGKIEVARVRFRYSPQGPPTLESVSLEARPGEFIALVGASGSGKSTLLRMLLGFERPESGAIYFDDQDLNDLDLSEVRSQIGVVLQNATLMAGDIYTNIIGSSPTLTIEDAWAAARMVGMEDEIKAMPMGMHTVISEGGGNFSGGQRQRLLIARAIVNRPRILFFDEATGALDNRAQEVVSRSLDGLQATRVVIAHRLSTIVNADRIYVFDAGRVVQVGTYQSLINAPGLFAELARRQLI